MTRIVLEGTPDGWKRPGCECVVDFWTEKNGRRIVWLFPCPKHDDHEPTDDEWRCPNCGKPE